MTQRWQHDRTETLRTLRRWSATALPDTVDAALDQVDVERVASVVLDRVDLTRIVSTVLERVDVDRVADQLLSQLDVDKVADRLLSQLEVDKVTGQLLSQLNVDGVVLDRVDLQRVVSGALERLDLTAIVVDQVDLGGVVSAALQQVDLTQVVRQQVDLIDVAEYVVEGIDLPQIIRDSTGSVASDAMVGLRMQGIDADLVVGRVVDRMLHRRRPRRTEKTAGQPASREATADPSSGRRPESRPGRDPGSSRDHDPALHAVDAVPKEARAFQGQRAGIVTRTAANVIDSAVAVGVLTGGYAAWCAILFLVDPARFRFPAPSFLALLICAGVVMFIYFTTSWATSGRTYGNHLLGLRVVNFRGERLRWPGAVVRAAFCVALPIGLYWAIISPTNRSLQDTILRTSVLYDWTTRRPPPRHPAEPE